MLLLDTNVVSEIRKIVAGRANQSVARWANELDATATFISAITLHELEHGVLLVERRDIQSGALLRKWLDVDVKEAFTDRVLSIDARVAKMAATLHVPNPAPINDAYIAATALVHNLTVATRNTSDFSRFQNLELINPWKVDDTDE